MKKEFFKRILFKVVRELIAFFVIQKPNRIVFIQESHSGSNSYALYKLADNNMRSKFDLILLSGLPLNQSIVNYINWYKIIASAKIIFTTHASVKPSKKHIHFQLWHGNATKKMGVMEHGNQEKFKPYKSWLNVDFIMSYSETYTTFLNACMVTDPKKYIITGAPRNDLLLISDGVKNLKAIFGDQISNKKIIWFAPTFRDYFGRSQGNKSFQNLFGFKDFDLDKFDSFLETQNCKIILKPHPQEEALLIEYFEHYQIKNVLLLKSSELEKLNIDFYEVLNSGDMLITDYSSLFYDFLLLKKPVLFTPVDIEKYEEDRGFLMEDFLNYAPGPVIDEQTKLMYEISKNLVVEKDAFKDKRDWMLKFHHRFTDSNSSSRIYDFIEKLKINKVQEKKNER
ncbi:CDP-glycerol glycerophosphotransferase family protein [bacterium]|nr:CDP-glycerol glycerophosphotransferase family protein [bacterium]